MLTRRKEQATCLLSFPNIPLGIRREIDHRPIDLTPPGSQQCKQNYEKWTANSNNRKQLSLIETKGILRQIV